jgi:SNF2 family DNA or RNA helicase
MIEKEKSPELNADDLDDITLKDGRIHIVWNPTKGFRSNRIRILLENEIFPAHTLQDLNGRDPIYLATNYWLFKKLMVIAKEGMLFLSDELLETVKKRKREQDVAFIPLLKPRENSLMNLVSVVEKDKIKCKKDFTEGKDSLYAEKDYMMSTYQVDTIDYIPRFDVDGNVETFNDKVVADKVWGKDTQFHIFNSYFAFKQNGRKILDHFHVPEIKDIKDTFPEKYDELMNMVNSYPYACDLRLLDVQKDTVVRLLLKNRCLLLGEQGCGKTVMGLLWALLQQKMTGGSVLIVAPLSLRGYYEQTEKGLIGENWMFEAKRFFNVDLKVISDIHQMSKLEKSGCYITHYDFLRKELENPEEVELRVADLIGKMFNTIVIDECQKIKGGKENENKTSENIQKFKSNNLLLLSGTPASGFVTESFVAFKMIGEDDGRFSYKTRKQFYRDFQIQRENDTKDVKYKFKALPLLTNELLFWKITQSMLIRVTKKDIKPDMVDKRLHVEWTEFGAQQYDAYMWWLDEKHCVDYILANYLDKDGAPYSRAWIETQKMYKIMTQYVHLIGVADAPQRIKPTNTFEPFNKWVDNPYNPKFYRLIELIKEFADQGEQMPVFFVSLDTLYLAHTILEEMGITNRMYCGDKVIQVSEDKKVKIGVKPDDRGRMITEFKKGAFQVLLCSVDTAGLGMNLEHCSKSIMYSLPWSFGQFSQTLDRTHRITSKKDVDIHVILLRNSIDESRYQLIGQKGLSHGLAWDGTNDGVMIEWNQEQLVRDAIEKGKIGVVTHPEEEVERKLRGMMKGEKVPFQFVPKVLEREEYYQAEMF